MVRIATLNMVSIFLDLVAERGPEFNSEVVDIKFGVIHETSGVSRNLLPICCQKNVNLNLSVEKLIIICRMRKINRLLLLLVISIAFSGCEKGGDVATYDGGSISYSELKKFAESNSARLRQQEYQQMYQSLLQMLQRRILEAEASKNNTTVAELIYKTVMASYQPASQQQLKSIYEQAFRKKGQMSFGAALPELNAMYEAEVKNQIKQQYVQSLFQQYKVDIQLEEPDLGASSGAAIEIDTKGQPFWGNEDASIVFVEFSDLECPYCRMIQPVIQQVKDAYKDKIKWVFIDFPLPFHTQARYAHKAVHCAGRQNKYFSFQQKAFASAPDLSAATMQKIASETGLDIGAFNNCLSDQDGSLAKTLDMNIYYADYVGVNATPTIYMNGVKVNARNFEQFKELIEKK